MATIPGITTSEWTVADLLAHFGPILHSRIRADPAPGSATEQDVLDIHDREDRLYELVDGVLVENAMGIQESFLAVVIARQLADFAARHDQGFVLGANGMARLAPGLVRIPDVSFSSWDRFPNHRIPRVAMLDFAPDLAVEVLSPSNARQEMKRKLHDYFEAGVRLVWYVDPEARTVEVFTAEQQSTLLPENQDLTGDPVLPGFVVPLRDLFAQLEH
jgi:Uma2 family endonuclease